MTREQMEELVAERTFRIYGMAAVSRSDALWFLGSRALARLERDPIRGLGPLPGTFYPWYVVDHRLIDEQLSLEARHGEDQHRRAGGGR